MPSDDAAALAGHDRLLQHDQVARRAERHERVRAGRDRLAVHGEPAHEGALQPVRRNEDPVGVDEPAGDRDAAQRDAAGAAGGRFEAKRPAAVLHRREGALPRRRDEVALRIADLRDRAERARAEREQRGRGEQAGKEPTHAPDGCTAATAPRPGVAGSGSENPLISF
jgi:hypothetical protein